MYYSNYGFNDFNKIEKKKELPLPSTVYYFAYGSNMNLQEMKKYVNNNMKIIGIGKLHNYIFKYRVFKIREIVLKLQSCSDIRAQIAIVCRKINRNFDQ